MGMMGHQRRIFTMHVTLLVYAGEYLTCVNMYFMVSVIQVITSTRQLPGEKVRVLVFSHLLWILATQIGKTIEMIFVNKITFKAIFVNNSVSANP